MSDQTQTKAQPGITRSSLWWRAALLLAAGAIASAGAGHFLDVDWGTPVAIALGGLIVGLSAVAFVAARHARVIERISGLLAKEFGHTWDAARGVRGSRYKRGNPRRVVIDYPASMPDHDHVWQRKIQDLVAARIDAAAIDAKWNERRNRVVLTARELTEADRAKRDAVERIGALLTNELGGSWDAQRSVRVDAFDERGRPTEVAIDYPPAMPDHDQLWRRRIEDLVAVRIGSDDVDATWDEPRNRVTLSARTLTARELEHRASIQRLHKIISPLFRGVDVDVDVPTWAEDDQTPKRIQLTYGPTMLDGSELWRKRVETTVAVKVGGRWRANFDPRRDAGFLEPRPELPRSVPHPGLSLYDDADLANPTLYYGVDENGDARGWRIGKTTTMPHMLVVGPTGGGKTTVLRSLIVGAVAQGIPVFAADPKMIELTPFYGFPGCFIASKPAEIAKMIESMEALMYARYEAIQVGQRGGPKPNLRPVLFILDELLIARMVLKRFWQTPDEDGRVKRGAPPWFESVAALLALARSAQVNVVIGVQRPDATMFDDGSRDNLRQRLSLMRLSQEGSRMMWGSPYVGVDLPMVQGRAMASPDGENPIEMQTYWVDDPAGAKGADRAMLEELRAHAQPIFDAMELPVDVSPFVSDPPEIDPATLPQSEADLPQASDGVVTDRTESTDYETERTRAESIGEDDVIVLDDGEVVTVTEIEQDPFDDDAVSISYVGADGSTSSQAFGSTDYLARVLDLEGVAA